MVPFSNLPAQYQSLREEIDAAIRDVLETGQFILGPHVEAFEAAFAAGCGVRHGIGVNSGTSALHLALLAAGIGPRDEVITVPFTFVATIASIGYTGARPILVDIDPETYTMDPQRVEEAITDRTRAILPVHLYGQPVDMDPILEIAQRRGLVVIEDAAQAHGASYQGRPAGSLGDMACFSFYPGKNLGACGEGGIVVTQNADYARRIRMLRDWGQDRRYHHALPGYNYRMEAIQGAVLGVKLRHLEKWTQTRRGLAAQYDHLLGQSAVKTPAVASYACHVYHLYVIRTSERGALQQRLQQKGIQTGIHYPFPVHLQEGYRGLGYSEGAFPVSEACAESVLSLPLYAEMTETQVQEVAAEVCAFPEGSSEQEGNKTVSVR